MIGAWQLEDDDPVTTIAIVADGYFSVTVYNLEEKNFVATFGGSWELKDNIFDQTFEFSSDEPGEVGIQESNAISLKNGTVTFTESGDTWTQFDDGSPGALAGAWLITGRERNGEMTTRTPGPRKTMKILSGTVSNG